MNVDWSKAPEWAQWVTRDSSGEMWWWEEEPECFQGGWVRVGKPTGLLKRYIEQTEPVKERRP